MVTFNVDSLDFEDDEELRTGTDSDFATRYSSEESRLELEDLTNETVGHIPRGTGTDLIGGKFAETVSEGKALADDGSVYDTIQEAVDNANSWVKVGPGTFNESVTIDTAGLTLEGSGERTIVSGPNNTTGFSVIADNVVISEFKITGFNLGIIIGEGTKTDLTPANNVTVTNVTMSSMQRGANVIGASDDVKFIGCDVKDIDNFGLSVYWGGVRASIINCTITNTGFNALNFDSGNNSDNSIIAHNTITNSADDGIEIDSNDCIIIGNIIDGSDNNGIDNFGDDNIIAKNRISNSNNGNIDDSGTGTVLDSNLTTE